MSGRWTIRLSCGFSSLAFDLALRKPNTTTWPIIVHSDTCFYHLTLWFVSCVLIHSLFLFTLANTNHLQIIQTLCTSNDTMTLKGVCNSFSRKPVAIDVVMLFTQSNHFLRPLCHILDNWQEHEDQGWFSNYALIIAYLCEQENISLFTTNSEASCSSSWSPNIASSYSLMIWELTALAHSSSRTWNRLAWVDRPKTWPSMRTSYLVDGFVVFLRPKSSATSWCQCVALRNFTFWWLRCLTRAWRLASSSFWLSKRWEAVSNVRISHQCE